MLKFFQILILIHSMYHPSTTNEIYKHEIVDYQTKYFHNLLKFYRGFDKIFHVDTETYEDAKKFFTFNDDFPLNLMVYNHDQSDEILVRPIGGSILNVFFFEDVKKIARYIKDYSNISGKDILMVITHNKTFGKKLPEEMWIKHEHGAGNILILNLTPEDVQFYHICQYCGQFEYHITTVQKTNTSKVKLDPAMIWPNSFRRFYANKFTVLFNQYFPFMHCLNYEPTIHNNKTYNRCLKWEGSEGNLLDTLSKTMNFSYELIALTEYITVSKIIPHIDRNRNIDFAIGGIGLSAPRIKKLPFTRMINYEKVVVMYKIHTGWKDRLFAFSNAFSVTIWCFLALTSIVVTLALFTFMKILHRRKKHLTFIEMIQVPPRMLVEQPIIAACLTKNIKTPVLIVLFCWMVGCIEFNTVYKSNLASRIIHPPIKKYRNVFGLLRRGYNIGMEQEKLPFLNIILNLKNPKDAQAVKEKFFNISVLCSAVSSVLNGRIAISGERSFLEHHCQTLYKKNYAYEVNYTPEPLSVVPHGWLFRKGSPYVESFNENIMRIQASGLMVKWLRDILWKKKRFFSSDKSNRRVKLAEFTSHFTLYAIGVSISMVAFLYEHAKCLIERRKKKVVPQKTKK